MVEITYIGMLTRLCASLISGLVIFGLLTVVYFIPTMVASGRRKRRVGAIAILNTFLGWTLVGWLVTLIWALTKD